MIERSRRSRRAKNPELGIWMNGERVGTWRVTNRGLHEFQYDAVWTNSPSASVLSLTLPFLPGNDVFSGTVVENFFENLLPDNREIRSRIQARFGITSARGFDLLTEIGRDCVGAIQIVPEQDAPDGWNRIDAEPLTDQEVENVLSSVLGITGIARTDAEFRISLAGAQEKTALLRYGGRWCLPRGATPTTHIFKLPLGFVGNMRANLSTSVENEWLCSKIVHAFGLPIAETEIGIFGQAKALVVTRFDRKPSTDRAFIVRIQQEDFCQANGVSPSLRYESDGGPGIASILRILEGSATALEDRSRFLKTQILFWMLAATDGHAKNFSIFHLPRSQFRSTPLYDVISAWPIIGSKANQLPWREASLAMAVRGKNAHYRLHEIQRRHFNEVARRSGVGADAEPLINELVDSLPQVIASVNAGLPGDFPAEVSDPILQGLDQAGRRLSDMALK
jgi:serine/threonine-protein kinase HipA